jgi:hypothetical protein
MTGQWWTLKMTEWPGYAQNGESVASLIRRTLTEISADLAIANAEIVALHDELAACSNAVGTDRRLVFRDGEWTSTPVDSPLLERIQGLRVAASVEADEARRARAEVAKLNRRLEAVADWYPGWMTGIGPQWQDELRKRQQSWWWSARLLATASSKAWALGVIRPCDDDRAKTLHVPAKDNGLYR